MKTLKQKKTKNTMKRERRNGESRNTDKHTIWKKGTSQDSFGNFSAHMTQNGNNFHRYVANENPSDIFTFYCQLNSSQKWNWMETKDDEYNEQTEWNGIE